MREGWKEIELGKLCSINMGQSPPSSTYNYDKDGLPFFQGKAEFTDLHPVAQKWCSRPKKIAETGDILISVRAPVGTVNIADRKCAIGRGLAAVRYPDCPKYIYYYIKSIEQHLDSIGTGTTFKAISGKTLRSIIIPLPPLPEQRAIVARLERLLGALDRSVAELEAARAKLGVWRQSVLREAFSGRLTGAWRLGQDLEATQVRCTREVLASEKTSIGSLPTDWTYALLQDLGELNRGKSKHRPRNDKSLYGGDYPFIQTGDVKAQNKIREFSQTYNEFGLKQSRLWPKGTLCITIAANIAETAQLGIDACFPDSIVGFTANEEVTSVNYIEYFFQHAKQKIDAYAPATAQKNINLKTLQNLIVPLPSLKEQQQIVQQIETRFSVADKLEEEIGAGLERARGLRQGVLKRAFGGELV